MIKALKVVMIVFGVFCILKGLQDFIAPRLMVEMLGMEEPPLYLNQIKAVLGAGQIAAGVWVIIATRDLLRNINWVKYAITWRILVVAAYVYSIIRGWVDFSDCAMFLIIAAVFAAAFLALYPWRTARTSD